jgi:Zn-finger nucleic acid-binding protein
VISEKVTRDKAASEYLKLLDQASISFSYTLFDDMFNDDGEIEKLKHLPGIKETIESFRTNFKTLSDEYIRVAMEKYAKKKKDIDMFQRYIFL